MKDIMLLAAGGLVVCIVFVFGAQSGIEVGIKRARLDAVQHNVARFVATTNGEVEFEWITNFYCP